MEEASTKPSGQIDGGRWPVGDQGHSHNAIYFASWHYYPIDLCILTPPLHFASPSDHRSVQPNEQKKTDLSEGESLQELLGLLISPDYPKKLTVQPIVFPLFCSTYIFLNLEGKLCVGEG